MRNEVFGFNEATKYVCLWPVHSLYATLLKEANNLWLHRFKFITNEML